MRRLRGDKRFQLAILPSLREEIFVTGSPGSGIGIPTVKRKYKTLSILAICFSAYLSLSSAYVFCDRLEEVDFLSPTLIFENPDQEDLLADQQSKEKIFFPGVDFFDVHEQVHLFEPTDRSSSLLSLLAGHSSIPLRR
jgi:hypothetical protein